MDVPKERNEGLQGLPGCPRAKNPGLGQYSLPSRSPEHPQAPPKAQPAPSKSRKVFACPKGSLCPSRSRCPPVGQWPRSHAPRAAAGGVCKPMKKSNRERDIKSLKDPIHFFPPAPPFLNPTAQPEPRPKTEGGDTVPQGGRDGSPPAQHPREAGEGWVGGAGLIPKGPIPNPD